MIINKYITKQEKNVRWNIDSINNFSTYDNHIFRKKYNYRFKKNFC